LGFSVCVGGAEVCAKARSGHERRTMERGLRTMLMLAWPLCGKGKDSRGRIRA
jgi:hypothetical protein